MSKVDCVFIFWVILHRTNYKKDQLAIAYHFNCSLYLSPVCLWLLYTYVPLTAGCLLGVGNEEDYYSELPIVGA